MNPEPNTIVSIMAESSLGLESGKGASLFERRRRAAEQSALVKGNYKFALPFSKSDLKKSLNLCH